jgi:hypothetical protein
MEKITTEDIDKALVAIKDTCPCNGKHPKEWYGYCMGCGIWKIHPNQAKAIKDFFNIQDCRTR